MNSAGVTLTALLLLAGGFVHAAEPTPGGEIFALKGTATATQGSQTTRLYPGASVIAGDRLRTGKDARLKLRMRDGTEIMLGENTEFVVREYELNETGGRAAFEIIQGFFRAVTGRITRQRENSFQVRTPSAIIGVRGTDFWGEQQLDRLRIALLGGTAVIVSNDTGSVELTEPGFGTEVTASNQPPRAPFRWSPEELERAARTVD